MFEHIWEKLWGIIRSRSFFMCVVAFVLFGILIRRVFDLQIIHGEDYLNSFELKIEKRRSIPATRGNIYDRNGILLAYNELAYSVTMEDVYESGRGKNAKLNEALLTLVHLIEKNGDSVISDFGITIGQDGRYAFVYSGNALMRFLADVYGRTLVTDLTYKEQTSTAEEVVEYLSGSSKFGIGGYTDPGDRSTFRPGLGFTKEEQLKVLTIRYAMNLNSFQKYIATTVASNVSERTVALVMENSVDLPGVAISEDTIRHYTGGVSMSQILGYTGRISTDELEQLREKNPGYTMNDIVGKSGIEQYMEVELQGTKGSETVYVDNLGKVIESTNYMQPEAGDDVYLTIDSTLQQAVYSILEQKIAGILLSKLRNVKEFDLAAGGRASDIIIPIYDVYYALIGNGAIDITRFSSDEATEHEREAYALWENKQDQVFSYLETELTQTQTPYKELPREYQVYESLLVQTLNDSGIIKTSEVDTEDPTYVAWTKEESISLAEYLRYAISRNWVDIARLNIDGQYASSGEMFDRMLELSRELLITNVEFSRRLYRYMLLDGELSPKLILQIYCDQRPAGIPTEEIENLDSGKMEPYNFMRRRIENLDVTPAELALDPYSGSIVITNVNNGEVLALVSYPSYDNNKMANGVDAAYYAKLRIDKSSPLINYATQQRTAPGSTFKMVSAAAGMLEGLINEATQVTCNGIFEEVFPNPKCWIYPGKHGVLNVTGAIENSCNYYFYELGYNMSLVNGVYNSEKGLETMEKYASMFGFNEKSGVEIDEAEPQISDADSVRTMIGQGTHNFTTAQLARYVTVVANGGKNYRLSLLDRLEDPTGYLIEDYTPELTGQLTQITASQWNAIHIGMRRVVENKTYFDDLGVSVAGKTGTAQESRNRANHALFVCYAPYEHPEIAIATRVAFGYSSDYAAQIAGEVIKYYYRLEDENKILSGTAETVTGGVTNGD